MLTNKNSIRARGSFLQIVLFILLFACVESAASDGKVKVIIHPPLRVIVNIGNKTTRMTRKEVSDIFLRKRIRWADNTPAVPLDLKYDDPTRVEFSKFIHGRSPSFIKNYWQQMIFGGYELPPLEKTVDEVLIAVAADRGAIGYIPIDVAVPDTVKEIEIGD
jgi:ABC-type phosphate transport system substrate-binding protein